MMATSFDKSGYVTSATNASDDAITRLELVHARELAQIRGLCVDPSPSYMHRTEPPPGLDVPVPVARYVVWCLAWATGTYLLTTMVFVR